MAPSLSKKACIAACLSLMAVAAQADVSYSFGSLLSGDGVPAWSGFGTVDITGETTNTWTFTLTLDQDMADVFGGNTFASALVVDFVDSVDRKNVDILSGDSVGVKNGTGPSGGDITFTFPTANKDRYYAGDVISWTAEFTNGAVPTLADDPFALHIQAIDLNGGGSAWYTTAVPEPSTYAMTALGLLAIGVVCARKRASNQQPS